LLVVVALEFLQLPPKVAETDRPLSLLQFCQQVVVVVVVRHYLRPEEVADLVAAANRVRLVV
jgi:hypothetical protein